MLWLSNVGWYEGKVVYVMLSDGTYRRFEDSYAAGADRESGGPSPPEGLFQPVERLGKIWRIIPGLIEQIGFGIEPQTSALAQMQLYQYGEMVYLPINQIVFAFWRAQPDSWTVFQLAEADSDNPNNP